MKADTEKRVESGFRHGRIPGFPDSRIPLSSDVSEPEPSTERTANLVALPHIFVFASPASPSTLFSAR